MSIIRVLIADDHALVRAGFCALLAEFADITVVAQANNGHEALSLIAKYQPDVALVDIAMPELNGLEVVAQINKDYPRVNAIILSMYANEEYVLRAVQVGAMGYLLKDTSPAVLEEAIRAVVRGEMYFSPMISKTVIKAYLRRMGNPGDLELISDSPDELLTPRQRDILQMIAEGRTTQEMATLLQISVKTVETHRMELMRRLDIHNVAGLVRYALRMGLVSPED
jgi:DNA-binding NarL/FixJ family response regulator